MVILETMREPDGPDLPLATQSFEVALATGGRQLPSAALRRLLTGASFGDGRWGWLDASPHGIGLISAETI